MRTPGGLGKQLSAILMEVAAVSTFPQPGSDLLRSVLASDGSLTTLTEKYLYYHSDYTGCFILHNQLPFRNAIIGLTFVKI